VTVVFFISGHGFGHASREVEVINALGRICPDLRVIIRSAVNPALLRRTLTVPFELRPGPCDTGIVQPTSVVQDDAATVREALAFYATFDERVTAESEALARDDVRLIVGDIPPLAFEVAQVRGVPSVAIGNFTWDWIYRTHPGFQDVAGPVLDLITRAYRRATHALELPFSGGLEVFPAAERAPLIARLPTRTRSDTRAHFGMAADRPLALLSFGGYGLASLDLHADCLDRWTVATTDQSASALDEAPRNVTFIRESQMAESGFKYEDLVAAADVVITKPGYGIISECMASGTAMLYTSRGQFREYEMLVRQMPRYVRCLFISHADLFAGTWRASLEAVLAQPPAPERLATNGAQWVAHYLARLL
jgi:hypothetical protein